LAQYPGIAILLAANRQPVATNVTGAALLPVLAKPVAELDIALSAALAPAPQPSHLAGIEITLRDGPIPAADLPARDLSARDLSVEHKPSRITVDLDVLPCANGVLLLGRDTSLERALRSALVDSRQRLRDLVEIASDFTWETSSDGRFTVVSAQGALGFTALEMIGRDPRDLLMVASDIDCFQGDRPSAEIWMRDAAGKAVCQHVLALPLLDEAGRKQGARGLARDITEDKLRVQDLATARHRERLLVHFFRVLRQADNPRDALTVALRTAIQALGAAGGQLFRWDDDQASLLLAQGEPLAAEGLLTATTDRRVMQAEIGDYRAVAMTCRRQEQRNGSLVLWRSLDQRPWDADDLFLLDELTDQLALVIHQLVGHEELWRLSATDSLTGLLNRRGFIKALAPLLGDTGLGDMGGLAGIRSGNSQIATGLAGKTVAGKNSAGDGLTGGALIYIDLDNFKLLNDRMGHAAGDAALAATADLLRRWCRDSDLLARLGGDEFVAWMPGIPTQLAHDRAAMLLQTARQSGFFSPDADPRLGMSIGIATLRPHLSTTVDLLLQRADCAMYESKRQGKDQISILSQGVMPGAISA
jgi:diguanylate cyclase (GGDEF)-like protein/PAS domain S-box-containing protein